VELRSNPENPNGRIPSPMLPTDNKSCTGYRKSSVQPLVLGQIISHCRDIASGGTVEVGDILMS
jgi:hypothetical protein